MDGSVEDVGLWTLCRASHDQNKVARLEMPNSWVFHVVRRVSIKSRINGTYIKGIFSAVVKAAALWPGDHRFKSWKQLLAKFAEKGCIHRSQVVRPFPRPRTKQELHAPSCLFFINGTYMGLFIIHLQCYCFCYVILHKAGYWSRRVSFPNPIFSKKLISELSGLLIKNLQFASFQ
jgi:hypothetical protein